MRSLRRLLGPLAFMGALTFWLWPQLPAADLPQYFAFADHRDFLGIANGLDVLSNLGFLMAGLAGLLFCFRAAGKFSPTHVALTAVLAASTLFTAFGSCYFHLAPTSESLFWDRLPMALGFVTMLSLLIADRIDERLGVGLSLALIPLSALSVIGWNAGWLTLKPYLILQFGSLVLIFLISALLPAGRIPSRLLWTSLGLYAFAKVFEMSDAPVFAATGFISGHTLKHLLAVLAILTLLSYLNGEGQCPPQPSA